jgi:hypothetical protein
LQDETLPYPKDYVLRQIQQVDYTNQPFGVEWRNIDKLIELAATDAVPIQVWAINCITSMSFQSKPLLFAKFRVFRELPRSVVC